MLERVVTPKSPIDGKDGIFVCAIPIKEAQERRSNTNS